MRIALKCAYNGTPFHGYARQPNVRTVEGEIINLLKENGYMNNPKDSHFYSASRTDKGVSALSNIVAFDIKKPIDNLLSLSNESTEDIIFYAVEKVNDAFYPRFAKQRVYRYYLRGYDDVEKMDYFSSLFIGTHDFSNFARIESGKNPIRTIDHIDLHRINGVIAIDFFAENFLWNQIRRIISAMKKLYDEKVSTIEVITALQNPLSSFDFGMADASCLILKEIKYDFSFQPVESYLKKTRTIEDMVIKRC